MALSHELCATQILNISRPPGWLDGQKHLRCRCSLPPFDAGNHSCLAPRVRRNNRTPPQNGFGRCPRGRSQPHRGLRQAHGEEDQCRREEGASPTRDTSPHSFSPGVSGFFHCGYVASTSPSPDAFGASMRASGAKSMREGSLDACNVDGSILGARRDRAWRPKRRDRASPALISLVVGECQGFSSSRRS